MINISEEDLIQSVAEALQYISYYHPPDFIRALAKAYEAEESPAARDAIAQILTNSRLCAIGHRPLCQDTGIVTALVEVGDRVRLDGQRSLQQLIDEGVRRAYRHPDNPLRASVVRDPAGERINTGDNTPAVVHARWVRGDRLTVSLFAKGGGSENKARLAMLRPGDDIAQWVADTLPTLGAGWCPPGVLGIGIGGTAEQALLLAKEALLEPVDIHELKARGPQTPLEALRLEIYRRANASGIGAQGLGGRITVVDVKIRDWPTHAASKPVALVPNCAANRHIEFHLDGSGPARFTPPDLDLWPDIQWHPDAQARRVDLRRIDRDQIQHWRVGERLLLTGPLLTARDAAHKRLVERLARGEPLPVDLENRFIYYVGPVDPVGNEVIGPAGPTTATRMDPFTEPLLAAGLLGTIGKAERGPEAIEAIRRHRSVYLIAVGGAAYLVAQAVKSARVLAFPELGMEAIYELEVKDMPVTVAVDAQGHNLHQQGPAQWQVIAPPRR